MQQESPITMAARAAADKLNEVHFDKVNELLKANGLLEEGEKLDEKGLERKGYLLNQVMLPGNEYRLQLCKIEQVVQYKAEVKFDLEVNDMADTTLEDTPERRAERAGEQPAEAETPAPTEPAEGEDKKSDE